MSARYAAMLRGIEHLLGALDVAGDVAVLHGAGHHEVDLGPEEVAQFVEQVEVRVRLLVPVHGSELDEQVDVAVFGTEVVAQCRAEDVQLHDPILATEGGDGVTLVLDDCDHVNLRFQSYPSREGLATTGRLWSRPRSRQPVPCRITPALRAADLARVAQLPKRARSSGYAVSPLPRKNESSGRWMMSFMHRDVVDGALSIGALDHEYPSLSNRSSWCSAASERSAPSSCRRSSRPAPPRAAGGAGPWHLAWTRRAPPRSRPAPCCPDRVGAAAASPDGGAELRIPPKANTLSAPSRTPVPLKPNTIGAKRRVCSCDAYVLFGFRSTRGRLTAFSCAMILLSDLSSLPCEGADPSIADALLD